MRFERYKVMKQSDEYSFHELSRMIDFSVKTRKELTESEYQYLLGRLAERKSDFFVSPKTNIIYTIGGSKDNRMMWRVISRPMNVYGVYTN